MAYNVIDVSHYQNDKGAINWQSVKNAGFLGVIIKAGGSDGGFYKDPYFEQNYSGAKAAGLHVGSYYFVGEDCKTAEDGEADANRFLEMLSGKQFDLPVYIDVEAPIPANKAGNTDATIAFCETMENAGYFVGIYASDISGFKEKLDISRLKDYTFWVARYGNAPQYVTSYGMWQYSSSLTVPGINGNVDHDYCYVDYPSIITEGGFNGYGSTSKPVQPADPTPEPTIPASGQTYTVVSGDNLSMIAERYGTTWQQIYNDNKDVIGSDPNLIKPGMVLTINGASSGSTSVTYTVVAGDNLSKIAEKYGTTWQDLYNKNKSVIGSDPNLIKPGMVLTIR